MASVTVSVTLTAGWAAKITVTVTGAASGTTMTLRRIVDGDSSPVLGAASLPAATTVIDDPEVPLGRPAYWVATLSSGESGMSAAATTAAAWPVLSEPYSGTVAPVIVVDFDDLVRDPRAAEVTVSGRADPVVIGDVESAPRASLTLMTRTLAQRDAVTAVMAAAAGEPVLLRFPCPGLADTWIARTQARTERRQTLRASDEVRLHDLPGVVLVGAPSDARRAAGDTLGDLYAAEPTTLGAIAARWATLGAIASADLRGI